MNAKTKLNLSAFILGLTSMIGQILIIRELVVIFYGNELSLGVILASWLFWTALGSSVLGRFTDKLKYKGKLLSYIQLLTGIALPLNIFLIRNIKSLLNIPAGKIIGFVPMLSSSFVSLSVTCILLGFTFTLASKIAAERSKTPSSAVARIYLIEGIGASIGGIIYSFFLIQALAPFQNALIAGSANLIISIFLNKNIFQLIYLITLSSAFAFNWPLQLERHTRALQFKPFELVESIDSIYGNLSVTKTGKEYSFYENGLLVFTSGDLLTSEESVHYALLEHPDPQNILLIGGGMGGALKEILKHPVQTVDYVELDPLIIKLAEKYIPPPQDPRLNIAHMDGRLFVKSLTPSKKYDVIILNLPDPYNAMLNRFYSSEFFGEVNNILEDGGVFSFSLSSSENYINPEQAYYLTSIYNTLKEEFSEAIIFPGDTAIFFASNKSDLLTYEASALISRLNERTVATKFVREYYMPFKLTPLRIKYIKDSIQQSSAAKINQDFKPIGYFYHTALWLSLFHSGKGILPYLETINLKLFLLIAVCLFVIAFLIQKLSRSSLRKPIILSVGSTGMSEISFQIIVILAFQFLYGYMYYRIGLILTSFMIGLVAGSFSINRILQKPGRSIDTDISLYKKTQIAICAYPLILPLVFISIAKFNSIRPEAGNNLQLLFTLLPIIAGVIGGIQFPLANKICLKSAQDVGKTTGLLYGIDLFGACIGGLFIALVAIPTLGIIESCVLLSIVNILVLILLNTKHK